jgi:methylated-DNA-protein-cysteine methyltransferase related protein
LASTFFARIKRDCLAIAAHIPKGKVTTFACLGKHLDVPPRHVAYVLATLTEDELRDCHWWRVVGNDGQLGKIKLREHGVSQADFLENEGVHVDALQVTHFEQHFVRTLTLNSGIAQQTRPVDAPKCLSK